VRGGKSVPVSSVPRLQAILFDLDGVVTDTAEYHYAAWKRLCDEMGIPFDRGVNEKLRGIGRRESFGIILDTVGLELPAGEIETAIRKKNDYYRDSLTGLSADDLLPGVEDFIREARDACLKLALVSASRNAEYVVERLGIAAWFDTIVDPARITRGKPDPEMFLKAADSLETEYRRCAGIEDAAAGIAAIRAAGMFSVGIGPAAAGADLPLENTTRLTLAAVIDGFNRAAGASPRPSPEAS